MVQLCLSQNGPTLSQNGTGVTKWYSFVTKWYRCHKMVQFSQNGPQQVLVDATNYDIFSELIISIKVDSIFLGHVLGYKAKYWIIIFVNSVMSF